MTLVLATGEDACGVTVGVAATAEATYLRNTSKLAFADLMTEVTRLGRTLEDGGSDDNDMAEGGGRTGQLARTRLISAGLSWACEVARTVRKTPSMDFLMRSTMRSSPAPGGSVLSRPERISKIEVIFSMRSSIAFLLVSAIFFFFFFSDVSVLKLQQYN